MKRDLFRVVGDGKGGKIEYIYRVLGHEICCL